MANTGCELRALFLNKRVPPNKGFSCNGIKLHEVAELALPVTAVLAEVSGIREPEIQNTGEQYFQKMAQPDLGLVIDLEVSEGKQIPILTWENNIQDFMRIDKIAELLNNQNMSDSDFRKAIWSKNGRLSIELLLLKSPLFSRLLTTYEGNGMSPLEHILKALSLVKTDCDNCVLIRWFTFFHDLGKTISYTNKMHGLGSALIAETYFRYANKRSLLERGTPLYDEQFINRISFLCKYHHFFEFYGKSKDVESFKQDYPELWEGLVADPELLEFLAIFTAADILTNPHYSHFLTKNAEIYIEVRQELARDRQ